MTDEYAMRLRAVEKSFVGVKVLHGIDLDLKKGEILGLVGENGAGKSTMMNVISGVHRKDAGEMTVFGEPYEPASPLDAAARGIAIIHQELNLFTNLTVAENMFIDSFPKGFLNSIDYRKINAAARQCVAEYELPVQPTDPVGNLPAGVMQMVEISKGLIKNARIMIFDEPTTSLSQREKDKLFATLNGLRDRGISIIYISHILDDVFHLCDRISVIRDGVMIGTREKSATDKNEVIRMMVGRELNNIFPSVEKEVKERVLFEAKRISYRNKMKNVSIRVHEGEIVGLYGLMGAGRTEFVKAVFGVETKDGGEIAVDSVAIENPSPETCTENGMALITEDRHNEGLLMTKPVYDNVVIVRLRHILKSLRMVDRTKEGKCVREAVDSLRIKVSHPVKQNADSLSGGNQQKVVFGKWVAANPRVFILDEPTRGVDVGAKYEIYSIIKNMAKNGSGVLFVSSEMEELMGVCDRILVMRNGELAGAVAKHEFNQETIANLAL